MDFFHLRTVTAKLLFIALCHTVLCLGQALPVSNVCLSSNGAACDRHRLSCSSDTDQLVLLDAVQGFSPSPASPNPQACPGDACSSACCGLTSFPCSAPVGSRQFAEFFTECWGKRTCAPAAALDVGGNSTSSETEREAAACNGSASLSALSYQCLPESSYREFWNDSSLEGSTVAARFTRYVPGWETAQRCRPPTDTLLCDVIASSSDVGPGNVTVTLVLHHSISRPRSCSALQLRMANSTTVEHPCQNPVEFLSQRVELLENSSLELVLSIREGVLPFQAWALATAETGNLTMTCGLGTCSGDTANISTPVLVNSSSTTPPVPTQRPCSCPTSAPRQSKGNDAVFFPIIMALGSVCILLMITQSITLILLVRRRRAALDQIYALDNEYSQPGEHEHSRSYPVTQGSTASQEQILLEDMTAVEDSGHVNGAAASVAD